LTVYNVTIWKAKCRVCGEIFSTCLEEELKHCNEPCEIAFGIEKEIAVPKVPSRLFRP